MVENSQRFQRLPGKSRRYHDAETGATVSRRKRDEILEQAGKRSRRDERGASRSRIAARDYAEKARDYAKEHDMSAREARADPEFRAAIADLRSTDWKRKRKALKTLGLRDGIPDYVKPGETDMWKQSGASSARAFTKWKKENGGLGKR